MKTKIQYTILLAVTALLAGCNNEQDLFNVSSNKGSFALNLNNGEIVVNTETRADPRTLSATDAANYNIMVYQNSIELWGQKKEYSALTDADCILSVGKGYAVYAESCTEAEAETGFGCPRFAGISESFEIKASETTPVSVTCTPANGGLCVVFDKSFTDVFGKYWVETKDSRNLVFNSENMATFTKVNGKDKRSSGAVAYYNMDPSSEEGQTVQLEIHAKGAITITKDVLVKKGLVTRFTVNGPGAGTGSNTGTIDIEIDYDDDYGIDDNPINLD
ncbi:MAG: DUF4493 domain-containing protein [Bacteroidaceae bacterium]|nr:DUF4493 domain-containing protein [Bacteroidaceae bacterium]